MSIIRFAHPTHIDELFITTSGHSFYVKGSTKTTFKANIKGLMRVVLEDKLVIVGGPFNTIEEAYAFIEKEFPNHAPNKVVINRLVRTRWNANKAA